MKKLWLISSLIIVWACRNQKVDENRAVPLNESIEIEINPEDIAPLSDSVQIKIIDDTQNMFQVKHGGMDQHIIDSVKTEKNKGKKAGNN